MFIISMGDEVDKRHYANNVAYGDRKIESIILEQKLCAIRQQII